jgi:hypothetical protein
LAELEKGLRGKSQKEQELKKTIEKLEGEKKMLEAKIQQISVPTPTPQSTP